MKPAIRHNEYIAFFEIALMWPSFHISRLHFVYSIYFHSFHYNFISIFFLRSPIIVMLSASRSGLQNCCKSSFFYFILFFLKSEIKVLRLHFVLYLWFLFALIPSFTAFHRAFFELLQMQREKPWFFFIIWFFFLSPLPVFSAPCRIQWHSFLMRLLSLLISVSFGKNEWQSAL